MKYRYLMWWIIGRRASVADDSEVFTAHRGTLGTPIAFGIAATIETAAVHLLVPWPWLQWTLLAASVWGMLSFAALLATHRVKPHILSMDTLTLRSNGRIVASIPRDTITGVRVHRRYGAVSAKIENARLFLPTQDGTCIDIELSTPADAEMPALLTRWTISGTVSSLSIQVDHPEALVRALRPTLPRGCAAWPSPRAEPRQQSP